MTLYNNKYRVETNRWQFWDYFAPGSYFITVCVQGRKNILGRIENRKMILSDAGIIVSDFFAEIPTYHKRIVLDEWIVMPNHFHCIMQMSKQVNIINKFQTSIIKTCPYEAKQVRMDG